MPVIGRLDRQVDEVLINPVSKKRGADDARDKPPPSQTPPPDETEEDTATHRDAPERSELPVWLL